MESIRKKLQKYDLIYGVFINFYHTDYHRDFEVFTYTHCQTHKLKILIKGVVKMDYSTKPRGADYTMDSKYMQHEIKDHITAYHWGIRGFELSNWKLEDNSDDILALQNDYNFKLFKITFDINSSDLSFIFHDLEIEELD